MVRDGLSIVLCGAAGQGVQTIEEALTHILKKAGHQVFATKEYMSRVRGGCNSTEIRVASRPVGAYVERIDILVALDTESISHMGDRVTDNTLVLGPKTDFPDVRNLVDVDFAAIAEESGSKLYANTVAVGVILGAMEIEPELLDDFLRRRFGAKDEKTITGNIDAGRRGDAIGRGVAESKTLDVRIRREAAVADHLLMNGATAVGLGAMAGGCNFVASYPMSPSTGVLVFLAQHAAKFGMVVEQAEDEIAAVNMCLGAWYAGARALVTTSGGGFALMTEGISLAGMIESPLVVHLAQRPGPATGLPTRTEQGDLNLALYAGHGEFPRIILAPGTPGEAFALTRQAFDLADRYQVPVIILTDQFLVDSYRNISALGLDAPTTERSIVQTGEDYRRYEITDTGISARGIPGHGSGLVSVDSDEHDEAGHITEDLDLRIRMVDKRNRKLGSIEDDPAHMELLGEEDSGTLLVGWGSTYGVVREAMAQLGTDDLAFLHLKRVYPLPGAAVSLLQKARRVAVVENNATAQLAQLIRLETGVEIKDRILKYSGLPFSVEEVQTRLSDLR